MDQGPPLYETHDCVKEVTLWAQEQEHFEKLLSVKTVLLQMKALFFKLRLFMSCNTFGNRVV